MTEIASDSETLPPAVEAFVLRWGDLGGQWGVNRSVAQIHALLFMSRRLPRMRSSSHAAGMTVPNSISMFAHVFAPRRSFEARRTSS